MAKPFAKLTMVMLIASAALLGLASTALADSWSDLDSAALESYGVSLDQIGQVSTGFPDGTWQPWRSITRAQFTKMADTAFAVGLVNPSSASFSDVPSTDHFYQYVEGAYAAGLVNGVGDGLFGPALTITREQAAAIVARKVAAEQSFDLGGMKTEYVAAALAVFGDGASVSAGLRAEVAFAATQGLIKGDAAGNLNPKAAMSRIAAAVLLIRAMEPATLELDESDNGGTVTLQVGDTVEVVLKGNPTTGFGWMADITEEDAGIIQQVGEPTYVSDSDLIGSGGTYTFTFKALKAGEAVLKLVYRRSWETDPPIQTFSVTVNVEALPLDGSAWRLEGWSVSSLYPGDFEITAAFDDGRISGKAAVNSYSGPYSADSSGDFLVGMLMQTLMAGSGPAMQAEAAYFDLLKQARTFSLSGDRLTLLDANHNELLVFARMLSVVVF
jgi:inhibitor of cysteine peptidase